MTLKITFWIAFLCINHHVQFIHGIMVDFGTRKGPILPPEPTESPRISPRIDSGPPAPVYESGDNDIPNPSPYKPYSPFQYRSKIFTNNYQKLPNSLFYGTEYDKKYNPQNDYSYEKLRLIAKYAEAKRQTASKYEKASGHKYNHVRRSNDIYEGQPGGVASQAVYTQPRQYDTTQQQNNVGYTGPQTFGPEHFAPVPPKYSIQYFGNYVPRNVQNEYNGRPAVPQFGIVYSAGVKYYVPRINSFINRNELEDNSVYDQNDSKYYYNNNY